MLFTKKTERKDMYNKIMYGGDGLPKTIMIPRPTPSNTNITINQLAGI